MTRKTPAAKLLEYIRERQAESDAAREARKRAIKDAQLEAAVQAQIAEAERVKRKAREALPRANAALRTAFRVPEGWESAELIEDSFVRSCWRKS